MSLTSPECVLVPILFFMVLVAFIEQGLFSRVSLDKLSSHLREVNLVWEVDLVREVDFAGVDHMQSLSYGNLILWELILWELIS